VKTNKALYFLPHHAPPTNKTKAGANITNPNIKHHTRKHTIAPVVVQIAPISLFSIGALQNHINLGHKKLRAIVGFEFI
jgi:hypothetical protein